MSWLSLGEKTLSFDWQFYSHNLEQTNLFRIAQTFVNRPSGKMLIGLVNAANYQEFLTIRGIYPSTNLKIIQIAIPEQLLESGNNFYPAIRIASRTRVYDLINWKITVEVFVDD